MINGLTMVELLAIFAILGIITAIAVPLVLGHVEKTYEEVCDVNREKLEKMYETDLVVEGVTHSDAIFRTYLVGYGDEVCPEDGIVNYADGEVHCSVHSGDKESSEGDEEGDVPFL
ncbi:type IV pilin protein [Bacillus weihaiensis]|uniref:type IV pilin protein n=1 Tax=Bacillus weihaiensis TaxID=1547283 RepID=UPI0011AB597C|nr:type II secretion system protein [Bacillus weihaiensis]